MVSGAREGVVVHLNGTFPAYMISLLQLAGHGRGRAINQGSELLPLDWRLLWTCPAPVTTSKGHRHRSYEKNT